MCLLKVLSPPKAIFMLEAHERLGGAGALHIYRIVPLHHFLITGILCQHHRAREILLILISAFFDIGKMVPGGCCKVY